MRINCYITDLKQDYEKFSFRGIKPLIKFLLEGIVWKQTETITIQFYHDSEKGPIQ